MLGIHTGPFAERAQDSSQTLLLEFLVFSKEIRAASTVRSLLLLLPCEVESTCLSCSAGKLVQSQHYLSFPWGCQEDDALISRLFSSPSSQVNIPISEGHDLPYCVPLTLGHMLEAWRWCHLESKFNPAVLLSWNLAAFIRQSWMVFADMERCHWN